MTDIKTHAAQSWIASRETRWRANLPAGCRVKVDTLLASDEARLDGWRQLLLASDVVPQWCRQDFDGLFSDLCAGHFDMPPTYSEMASGLHSIVATVTDEAGLKRQLRLFRKRIMTGVIWREATGRSTFGETTRVLSDLADLSVQTALAKLTDRAAKTWGTPEGSMPGLLIVALGKLGGRELNLSSDIDLLMVYEQGGQCRPPPPPPATGTRTGTGPTVTRRLSNREYYTRLGQKLVQTLDEVTEDGFVFRVDMRLRPFGDSGALVTSLAGMEQYYEQHGRDWERYMLIKMRHIAGPERLHKELFATLKPFIYRRHLDFGVVESLRDMQRRIAAQASPDSRALDVKLGAGGIRTAEFLVQALQLIHGGRLPKLQCASFLEALQGLEDAHLLTPRDVEKLRKAYVFMRNMEHRLQAHADHQTHGWPERPAEQDRLAWNLGLAGGEALRNAWETHCMHVLTLLDQLFGTGEPVPQAECPYTILWQAGHDKNEFMAASTRLDLPSLGPCSETLEELRSRQGRLPAIAAERLDRLMPKIIRLLHGRQHPERILARVGEVIRNILRRSVYLCLLDENPHTLQRLMDLCGQSTWITTHVSRQPHLLDDLLGRSPLETSDRDLLFREARHCVSATDIESGMDKLRRFKASCSLETAISDLADKLPLVEIGDHVSWIAEAILTAALQLCWQELMARHGAPGEPAAQSRLAIIGYGKLGGLELGYSSDLDLVFVHDDPPTGVTTGTRPVAIGFFYHRLVQRLLHVLTAHTFEGKLYDIDTRLRPSGRSGSIISTMAAFAEYYREKAWTWEHQSLVKARAVAGSVAIAEKFACLRRQTLQTPRDRKELRTSIARMRERLFASGSGGQRPAAARLHATRKAILSGRLGFDPKRDAGGIIDIDFIVQYLVLGWAHDCPSLTRYTDNIRIMDVLSQENLLPKPDLALLQDTYRHLRTVQNRHVLTPEKSMIDLELLERREAVAHLWERLMSRD